MTVDDCIREAHALLERAHQLAVAGDDERAEAIESVVEDVEQRLIEPFCSACGQHHRLGACDLDPRTN